jgi:hypothetical protein
MRTDTPLDIDPGVLDPDETTPSPVSSAPTLRFVALEERCEYLERTLRDIAWMTREDSSFMMTNAQKLDAIHEAAHMAVNRRKSGG